MPLANLGHLSKKEKPLTLFHHPLVHPYLYLLITLFALLVIYPLISHVFVWRALMGMFVIFTLIACVMAVSTRWYKLLLMVPLALLMVVPNWFIPEGAAHWLDVVGMIAGCALLLYVVIMLVVDVFIRHSKITAEMIYGAVSIYLLIGLLFAFIYSLIYTLVPNAFESSYNLQESASSVFEYFTYFSYVTLTTLGYGDITPNALQAGALAYLEAIIGQIYLTVMVARLVGLYIAQSKR